MTKDKGVVQPFPFEHEDLRTPARQQHPQKKYICNEDDLGCLNDYFYAALDQNEPKITLIRLWDQEFGVIRSLPHTSAQAPALCESTHIPTQEEFIAEFVGNEQRKRNEHCSAIRAEAAKAARKAREDVLKEVRDLLDLEKYYENYRWVYQQVIESLRRTPEQPKEQP